VTLRFPGAEEREARTEAAMQMPLAGDVFEEMLSFWVFVVSVSPRAIVTVEGNGPGSVFKVCKLRTYSPPEEFRKQFAYRTIPGYSIQLLRAGDKVEGWAEKFGARPEALEA